MSKWETVTFDDIFEDCTKHGTKIPKEYYLAKGANAIIDQGQMFIAGYCDESEGMYSDLPAIIFGDHTRSVKYIDFPFFLGADGVKLLKDRTRKNHTKYLFYALQSVRIPNTGYNRHFKWLHEIRIPLPPLAEQQKIAAELDKIIDLIVKRKSQIEKLDLLIKAKFVEMFGDPVTNPMGWEYNSLGQLGDLNRGVSKHRPRNDPKLLGGQFPLIQTGEVAKADLYIEHYTATYSEIGLRQSKLWKQGTLCITIAANIAKTAILKFDACFPDSIVGFSPNNKTNQVFVHYWFGFFQKILEVQAPESAQKNINLRILNDLQVILPPLPLQTQFADFVQKTEQTKTTMQTALSGLETLYKARMQEYFG